MITGMPRIAIAVHNFEAAVAWFGDRLGLPVVDLSANTAASLGAKLAMCVPAGGSNIELMCPADPDMPLSQSLERFLARRGEGLFALMLEAADPNAEAERLAGNGLAVLPLMAGAGGRDIHPRSTHGVLIRVYPTDSFTGQAPRRDQALALSGVARVMIAVNDVQQAVAVYGAGLGLAVSAETVDGERGLRSVLCRPPAGGVIELVSVADGGKPVGSAVAERLAERGEGLFALVLQADDPARARAVLAERDVPVTAAGEETQTTHAFGARIYIEKRSGEIPGPV